MRIAAYPGSFNPFHDGHLSIVKQVLPLVDTLYIAIGHNPEKTTQFNVHILNLFKSRGRYGVENEGSDKIKIHCYDGLLVDYVKRHNINFLVKGIRNSQDLEYEKVQQYWNEDLEIKIPTLYIIADRTLCHISSSAIRMVDKLKEIK
jgi:pantetheine-phosphate adenylyltransferase